MQSRSVTGYHGRKRPPPAAGTGRRGSGPPTAPPPRATLTGHSGWVSAVAIAPDGTPRATLTGHDDTVSAVAIAPDGTWLATGSGDGTVRIWAADGTPRATLTGHSGWVSPLGDRPGRAPGGDRPGRDLAGHRRRRRDGADLGRRRHPRATLTGHSGWVSAVAIAPDGTWLATGGGDGTVRIWAADGSSSSSATAIRVNGDVSGCAWFPGSTDLCITGNRGLYRFSLRPPGA